MRLWETWVHLWEGSIYSLRSLHLPMLQKVLNSIFNVTSHPNYTIWSDLINFRRFLFLVASSIGASVLVWLHHYSNALKFLNRCHPSKVHFTNGLQYRARIAGYEQWASIVGDVQGQHYLLRAMQGTVARQMHVTMVLRNTRVFVPRKA